VEEAVDFLGATILERFRRSSFDVHREECVREPCWKLLNTNEKTRDHGLARADLKKVGIRQELWLDDFIKGTELPTSCITLSMYEKEFCAFLKNVKVPSGYSTNVSRLISLPCIAYADDCRRNSEYPTGQCSGGYYELLLFLQCNWSKSTKSRSSGVIAK
jgi:hypothetical protein